MPAQTATKPTPTGAGPETLSFEEPKEHELLRETVREFFRRELPPERVREFDRAREALPSDLYRKMAELGWWGMVVPKRYGGSEVDILMSSVMIEELARGWAALGSDYVLASMAAVLLSEFGTEAQREMILPGLAAGSIRVAFSLTEPSGGTDVLSGKTQATLDGEEWVIRGQKLYTTRAPDADYLVVLARTDPPVPDHRARGWSLILTAKDQPAIEVRKLQLLGHRSAGTSEVFYDGARSPSDWVIGERGRGFYHLIATLNNERILDAAIGLGVAQAAFEEALRYAKERIAFGRPIGAFQAIQHYIADMAIDIEGARLLIQKAAWLQSHGKECSVESAIANVAAGEVAVRVTDKGMRILAGHGFTEDSPMERYLRDARLQVFSPVSNEVGRNFIGERLGLPRSF